MYRPLPCSQIIPCYAVCRAFLRATYGGLPHPSFCPETDASQAYCFMATAVQQYVSLDISVWGLRTGRSNYHGGLLSSRASRVWFMTYFGPCIGKTCPAGARRDGKRESPTVG